MFEMTQDNLNRSEKTLVQPISAIHEIPEQRKMVLCFSQGAWSW